MKAATIATALFLCILACPLVLQAAPKAERPERIDSVEDAQFCRKCGEPKLIW